MQEKCFAHSLVTARLLTRWKPPENNRNRLGKNMARIKRKRNQMHGTSKNEQPEVQQRKNSIRRHGTEVSWTHCKFHQFIYGRNVEVENDHKPLESIFKKSMSNCPPRIQRFMLKLQKYDINVTYRPGKEMIIADTLSRDPLKETEPGASTADIDCQVHMIIQNLAISEQKQEEIKKAKKKELSKLRSRIKIG